MVCIGICSMLEVTQEVFIVIHYSNLLLKKSLKYSETCLIIFKKWYLVLCSFTTIIPIHTLQHKHNTWDNSHMFKTNQSPWVSYNHIGITKHIVIMIYCSLVPHNWAYFPINAEPAFPTHYHNHVPWYTKTGW